MGWTYRDSQVITASQFSDLTNASERSTHDNSVISEFLVVVEDALDGCNSWVFLLGVGLSGLGLVPIENTADEGRDEECAGFGSGDGLDFGEEKGEVAVDGVLLLQDTGGLDTFPGGGDLDQDAGFIDTDGFVELEQSASFLYALGNSKIAYLNDVKSLINGTLGVKRESGINLS